MKRRLAMGKEEIREVLRKLQEKKNSELWLRVNGVLIYIRDDVRVEVESNNDLYRIYIMKEYTCVAYIAEYSINDISFEEANV